jgi:hypothetical protein
LSQFSGFRPARIAPHLDFLKVHFYPFAEAVYQYGGPELEGKNLAYLESVVRECALTGKPVVLGEFGWYGGGKLSRGPYAPATEEQQAEWCRKVVETTAGLAQGWLNWGLYDHPEANDITERSGLLTASGKDKVWAGDFQKLAHQFGNALLPPRLPTPRPSLDWGRCTTSTLESARFQFHYYRAWLGEHPLATNAPATNGPASK